MSALIALFASLALGELHQAARVCDADRMRHLLSKQPKLNEADEKGMTPLLVAIEARQRACVGLLVKAGADLDLRDKQGRSAFDYITNISDAKDRAAMAAFVWRPSPGTPTGPVPWSLESSAARGQTNLTKMLLEMGSDPNAIGTRGTTPLGEAALKGDVEGVRALIARGAQVSAVDQAGMQAIHDAALGDGGEVIRELMKHGADVNARSRGESQTPLHMAAAMGKVKAVEALLAVGADRGLKDANGRTAVEAAERAGLSDVVALLKVGN